MHFPLLPHAFAHRNTWEKKRLPWKSLWYPAAHNGVDTYSYYLKEIASCGRKISASRVRRVSFELNHCKLGAVRDLSHVTKPQFPNLNWKCEYWLCWFKMWLLRKPDDSFPVRHLTSHRTLLSPYLKSVWSLGWGPLSFPCWENSLSK